jgi:hypothetical protein
MVCGRCQKLVNGKLGCPVCRGCFNPSMAGPELPEEKPRLVKDHMHDSPSSEPCAYCADVICSACRTVIEGRHTCVSCREKRLAELREAE